MIKRGLLPGLVVLGIGIVLGSLWGSGGLRASPPFVQEPSSPDPDLEAIKAVADKYTAAFNARDAAGIAQLFTEEGEFVDGGDNVTHGKKAIEQAFAQFFIAHPPAKLVIDMDVVRRLGSNALVEEGIYHFEGGDSKNGRSRYVMLHVKQNDGWRIASIRTNRDTTSSPHDALRQLEWLIGSWVDEGATEVIKSTWKWSEDGNYILGDFSVESKGEVVMKGSQRLGWDGSRERIRSWVFDSEGGFVEGLWHKTPSGQWIVKNTGVNSDGETTSQTTVYTPQTKDRFFLTMRDRMDGDEVLPDITVTIVRAFPGPQQ
jgi:uncharacterized protein (TIGR02246 family)